MPWQRLAADVGGEYDPKTGIPYYREVVITVPRQSGKTTLFLTWQINRCLAPRWKGVQRSVFTAQSGKDARDKWLDELFPLIKGSGLYRFVAQMNRGMGNESILWRNGSLIRLLSTSTSSGHSKSLHQAVLDEIWHDTDDRREQGLRPAMVTIPAAQLLVCSTAGTATSAVLKRKVEVGRTSVAVDSGRGIAYFEWSAPDDADPSDPATWHGCMPALCPDPPCRCDPEGRWRHTVTEKVIQGELDSMGLREFRRPYLNQWPDELPDDWQVIDQDSWIALTDPESAAVDPVAFAIDTTPDRSFTSIAVAGRRSDGLLHVEVIEHRPGTGWVAEWVKERDEKWRPCAWVLDAGGPAGSLVAPLEAAGIELVKPTTREAAHAAQAFFDAAVPAEGDPVLRHRGQAELNAALAGALKREMGDMWLWARKGLSVDISPLVAVTLAAWGYAIRAHLQEEQVEPFALWGEL